LSSAPLYSPAQIWEQTLAQLLLRVTRQNYETWLRSTAGDRFEGTTLVVAVPNDLACDWLSTRMRSVIAHSLTAVAGAGLSVKFEIVQPNQPCAQPQAMQPSLVPEQNSSPLNPRLRFETFLEADFNRLALTAARDIAVESSAYSPLFISGPSGSGKTHLLHAIAHVANVNRVNFLLVSAEQFLSEFTTAIRNHNGAAFRARYRTPDLLLIDGVHMLLGKKATLNEFYSTLATLHDEGKRIVVTGDASAASGEAVRFRTHLQWGLVAEIKSPSLEDRVHFVARKTSYQEVALPEEVQHYLALRVRTSIRDLEGAVNRVTALARISHDKIDIDFAAAALQPITTPVNEGSDATPSDYINAVCRQVGISYTDIVGPKRTHDLTHGRHLAMYLLRKEAGLSFAAIAHLLGKKDHSTVVHACNQITKELERSPEMRADIDAVMASLRGTVHSI
jgi:chromosomal replication initiator protein